jgi:hypothetical protein
MELRPSRIEDVPVLELSGLALTAAETPDLLAVGDRRSMLVRATLTDGPLEWTSAKLDDHGRDRGQFEGVAVSGDGTVLLLREDPPTVSVVGPDGSLAGIVALERGEGVGLEDVFDEAASCGEGLVQLPAGRLLVAQEKHPPLLVEFGSVDADALGVSADSLRMNDGAWDCRDDRLRALAAWKVDGLDDISDLAVSGGVLYCLSDQSCRVVAIELPLDPGSRRAHAARHWDLKVPERSGEHDGKPEGLVVTNDGTFIVGLDTPTPTANLCWFPQ